MNIDVTFKETDSNFDVDFVDNNSTSSTNDHNQLINRNKAGQHPISAITNLEEELNEKLNSAALPTAINTALAQAKESGEFDGKNGTDGKSPYIAENGNWVVWDDETKTYIDTGISASGGSGGITPEQEEQLEQNTSDIETLQNQMGDVETALDNIIVMQTSYIGGE